MALTTGRPEGDVLAAVSGYVADAVGCSADRVTAVIRFPDGNRHAVYRVSYLDDSGAASDVVVRISNAGDPLDCAQAEREAQVLEKVGGVAAPLLYDFRLTSPWFDRPVMCMQCVAGDVPEVSSTTPAELDRLGAVVAWVHARPTAGLDGLSPAGDVLSYAHVRLQSILSTFSWARDPLPRPTQSRLRAAAASLEDTLTTVGTTDGFSTGAPLALLHGDIGPGNVLWGPDPVLIDWEYARLGDPADEIAYLFDQNGLSAPQREAFWRGYGASVSQPALADITSRVDWWEPVTLFGSLLWWVERWVRRTEADAAGEPDRTTPKEPAYYLEHVARRLDRFEAGTS